MKQLLNKLFQKELDPLKEILAFHQIDGWLSEEEAIALYKTANSLKRNAKIIEIGSWKGKSTYCLTKGLKSGIVYAIDPFDASGDVESEKTYRSKLNNKTLFEEFNEKMTELGVINKIQVRKGYSFDFISDFSDESIDFLFIDGDHSIEGTKFDFENYFPKLKKGGFLAFHDYKEIRDIGPTWVVNNCLLGKVKFKSLNDSLWLGVKL